jgi:hypothetical protein
MRALTGMPPDSAKTGDDGPTHLWHPRDTVKTQ